MPIAYDMMKGGVSAGAAKALNGTTKSDVSASATQTQNGATALVASNNVITTCATAGDSVRVPSMEIGDEIAIFNATSTTARVWPASGEQINSLGANNGFLLAPLTAVKLKKFTATRLMGFLSA